MSASVLPLHFDYSSLRSPFRDRTRLENIRSAKRVLFQAESPEEIDAGNRFLQEELSKQCTNEKNKWNFDFLNGKPLSGRYAWEMCPAKPKKRTIQCEEENSDCYPVFDENYASERTNVAVAPELKTPQAQKQRFMTGNSYRKGLDCIKIIIGIL